MFRKQTVARIKAMFILRTWKAQLQEQKFLRKKIRFY